MVRSIWLPVLMLLAATVSCKRSPEFSPGNGQSSVPSTNTQVFSVKGVVISLNPSQKQVEIKHEEIPGYMPAMTMPFEVKDTNELAGLEPGQPVAFRMVVTATNGWIEQIHPLKAVFTNGPPETGPVRVARSVEPLSPGDPLPDYSFTNQFGRVFSTAQFKGQALAVTFFFIRCPYPNFCPRMTANFEEAQQKLLSLSNGPTNWHLLTISFDPAFDKPELLKAYAEAHHYDPAHWTFATGPLVEITAIAEQFGLAFWHDQSGSISHNLRTAVIDSSGRLQKTFEGNSWTADELVAEILKAAK